VDGGVQALVFWFIKNSKRACKYLKVYMDTLLYTNTVHTTQIDKHSLRNVSTAVVLFVFLDYTYNDLRTLTRFCAFHRTEPPIQRKAQSDIRHTTVRWFVEIWGSFKETQDSFVEI